MRKMEESMFEIKEDCLLITLPEEIDHHNAKGIRRMADRYICDNRVSQIVFDFGNTKFMDSSGIGLLAGRNEKISYLGGRTIVMNANDRIKKMLQFSGMDREVCIYEPDEVMLNER